MADVLDHLTEEHRSVERLLAELADSDPGAKREALLGELESSLATHMEVEERFVYPIAASLLGREEQTEATNEHDLIRGGLDDARRLVAEPGFGAAIESLQGGIGHHVEEEESEVFPELRDNAADEIAALPSPDVLEARVELHHETKSELYRRARESGIPNRSTMSKEALEESLAGT